MAEQPYTVVVGVSATSKSSAALTWAQGQASQNGGHVIAVRAWKVPSPQATLRYVGGPDRCGDDVEQEAQTSLAQDVAAALGPDHRAELRLVRGGTYRVLVEAAEGADLLVVDAPRQLLVGPMFAHRLIYAASCPVVVMPAESSDGPSRLARAAGALGRSALAAAGTAGRPGYRPPTVR